MLVAVGMTGFGVMMALFNRSGLFAAFNAGVDPAFWGSGHPDPIATAFQGWVYGAWGATVAGLGWLGFLLIRGPFRRRETWARNALATTLGIWFLLDTGVSLAHGVWLNVAVNLFVMSAFGIPMALSWADFSRRGAGQNPDQAPSGEVQGS